jgi:hypothetical protein
MPTLLERTGPISWKECDSLHKVPDHIVFVDLASQVEDEFGSDAYVVVALANGVFTRRGLQDFGQVPDGEKLAALITLCRRLNQDVANGGHWVTLWSFQEQRLCALWRDEDGDMQIPIFLDEPWARCRTYAVERLASEAALAYEVWKEMIFMVLQLKPEETVKLAQGELPKTWKRHFRQRLASVSPAATAAGWQ